MSEAIKWIMIALLLLLIAAAVFMLLRSPGRDPIDETDSKTPDLGREGASPTPVAEGATHPVDEPAAPFDQDRVSDDRSTDPDPVIEETTYEVEESTTPEAERSDEPESEPVPAAEEPSGPPAEPVAEESAYPAEDIAYETEETSTLEAEPEPALAAEETSSDEVELGAYGPGSASPLADGSAPAGWGIKGNAGSMLFHTPDSPSYDSVRADVWFVDEETARNAGFVHWDRRRR